MSSAIHGLSSFLDSLGKVHGKSIDDNSGIFAFSPRPNGAPIKWPRFTPVLSSSGRGEGIVVDHDFSNNPDPYKVAYSDGSILNYNEDEITQRVLSLATGGG